MVLDSGIAENLVLYKTECIVWNRSWKNKKFESFMPRNPKWILKIRSWKVEAGQLFPFNASKISSCVQIRKFPTAFKFHQLRSNVTNYLYHSLDDAKIEIKSKLNRFLTLLQSVLWLLWHFCHMVSHLLNFFAFFFIQKFLIINISIFN